MGGLGLMAWQRACQLTYGDGEALAIGWLRPREMSYPSRCANSIYYDIVDCITFGHQWRAEIEFNSCARCRAVKANRDFKPGEFHRGY
jgi:hypothetical protein